LDPLSSHHSCKRASFSRTNPARARHLFLKPESQFTEWVKISATAEYQKTQCTGIAASARLYHTLNKTLAWTSINLAY